MPSARLKHHSTLSIITTIYLAALIWLVGSAAGSAALAAWPTPTTQSSTHPEAPIDDTLSPAAFIAMALAIQLAFIAGTILTVWFLRSTRTQSEIAPPSIPHALRLTPPRIKLWVWPLLVGGNIFLWWATSAFFSLVFTDPGEHLENLGNQIQAVDSKTIAALTLLAVGIMPGFGEELIFRGFMLRRFKDTLPGWAAVLLVSLLFAASHGDPKHILLILPLGLWWTAVSSRAGSIWPGIFLHAMNNSWTLILQWTLADAAEEPVIPTAPAIAILAVTGTCFIASIIAISGPGIKEPPPPTPTP